MRRILIVIPLALAAVLAAGCNWLEPKTVSPWSGQPATEADIVREATAREAQAKEAAAAKLQAAEKAVRQATALAEKKTAEIAASVTISQAEASKELALVKSETGVAIAEANAVVQRASTDLSRELASLASMRDAALADIDSQRDKFGAVLTSVQNIPVVGQALGAAGVDPSVLLALAGVGGVGYMARRNGKAKDAAWDEATAIAQKAAEERLAAERRGWDEATAHMAALFARPPQEPKA